MEINIYQVDAFADKLFEGNPAAVCPLDKWIDDKLMLNIAAENNLAETAFFVKHDAGEYEIRFFMPYDEIDLCGHATLASAFVIFNYLDKDLKTICFKSKVGKLKVVRGDDGYIVMNFPSRPAKEIDIPKEVLESFNFKPLKALACRDLILCFENEKQIRDLEYNLNPLKKLPYLCVIATARGENSDFASRVFDPNDTAIPEDPVTGSVHASLIPYWKEELNKNNFIARQLSKRGGELICKSLGDRVEIAGKAILYLKGVLFV